MYTFEFEWQAIKIASYIQQLGSDAFTICMHV